jgi:hypothetical protein
VSGLRSQADEVPHHIRVLGKSWYTASQLNFVAWH